MMETAIALLKFIPDKIFSNLIPFAYYLGIFCVICLFFYVVWKSKNSALTRILYTILISILLLQFTLQEISSKQTQSRHRAYRLFFSFITIKIPDYSNAPEKSASLLKVLREWRTDENRDVMSLLNMICRQCPKSKSQNDPKLKLPTNETSDQVPIIEAPPIKPGPKVDYTNIRGYPERVDELKNNKQPSWKGRGILVTGKLKVEGVNHIKQGAAKTSFVTEDGIFAQAVYLGKTLRFIQHGYEPQDIYLDPKIFRGKDILDLGKITLWKANPEHLSKISFSLEFSPGVKHAVVTFRTGWLSSYSFDERY